MEDPQPPGQLQPRFHQQCCRPGIADRGTVANDRCHAGALGSEPHGGVFGVEPELRPAALGASYLQIFRGRHGAGIVDKSPATHERGEGDVEGASGLLA